ncbi:hypothetical protein SeMB42_g02925 [Synchytrium endobioticum]|uniref:Actin interacting protein 3 C-terminal domain-containing protein n=1 Tax=Synchytrium endobioticum TaxID=286115 RepID=A0A507DB67_9FUNG|nr:hypothetical protein SeLEV6574_g03363 [Synchytrium endobioticum]TPX48617.1 hypothetical protein SeMB42_g02925 [Synchytrium endobioticum]
MGQYTYESLWMPVPVMVPQSHQIDAVPTENPDHVSAATLIVPTEDQLVLQNEADILQLVPQLTTICPVFLQIGTETKKTVFEGLLSMTALYELFIQAYAANYQKSPSAILEGSIYVKDDTVDVFYELEDLGYVKPHCILRLKYLNDGDTETRNIKLLVEQGFSALTKEILDLRRTVLETSVFAKSERSLSSSTQSNTPSKARRRNGSRSLLPSQSQTQFSTEIGYSPSSNSPPPYRMPQRVNSHPLVNKATIWKVPSEGRNSNIQHCKPESISMLVSSSSTTLQAPTPDTTYCPPKSPVRAPSKQNSISSIAIEIKDVKQRIESIRSSIATTLTLMESRLNSMIQEWMSPKNDAQRLRSSLSPVMSRLETTGQTLSDRMSMLSEVVDSIRMDVTSRKSRPSIAKLGVCFSEMDALKFELQQYSELLNEQARHQFKDLWEMELSNIVQEQSLIKDAQSLLDGLMEDEENIRRVAHTLRQVQELKSGNSSNRPSLVVEVVAPEDAACTMQDVLTELRLSVSDESEDAIHAKRMEALEKALRMRQWEAAHNIDQNENEFERELRNSVRDRTKMRGDGAIEELEKRRAIVEAEYLRRFYAGL